ncbi:hypothetical protein [Lyngbya confervoides]|uniref:ParB/Sulfiredoxin domain-containing protein n=1 Tax=Lyngbya confervoides BDU141951 TaxID=1574623 RepID=A0ABD4T400_9CYAN|nr:hypothetical protein [Lyngbya confervoides]MCM1983156.1 hypothetical protein [Lyngbya confervoides BDU141951]
MSDSYQTSLIETSQLFLDPENPRLTSVQANGHDAIRAMTKVQGDRVLALAEHLLENGANPTSLMMVMPSENDADMFCVLDGNRRLTALKLLESPLLAEGILTRKSLQMLKRLSDQFERTPITRLNCVVFANRAEADPWIQLTHRGLNKGAGMLAWDGQVGARYDECRKGHRDIGLQLLDFVKEQESLSEDTQRKIEEGKFPITTLNRLLSTPYVRKKLGIDKEKEDVLFLFPQNEVAKGLSRVVEELASGDITVSDLKKQDQRIDYINKFESDELPASHSALPQPTSLKQLNAQPVVTQNSSSQESSDTTDKSDANGSNSVGVDAVPMGGTQGQSRSQSSTFPNRKTLIPRSCRISISQKRIHDLFKELKRLDLTDFSNAGAVMLRVFIELSVDHFVEVKLGWDERQTDNSKLKHKISSVAQFLEDEEIMTRNELAPIRKAATGDGMLAASVKSMNQYVHNRYFSPVASELVVIWDDFQVFIQKIWEVVE